ncbi:MAG TPA: transposase [Gaiellaceae bacterium]|nr:transposase [Gaiellaceae bacterium]
MPRPARSELPDFGVFHVTARGVAGCAIQADDTDRNRFVRLLRLATTTAGWRVLAYCLMTNHFHLVLLCERDSMSRGMHALNFRYAQAFNTRYSRRGHLFQERYHARAIRDDEHLAAACAYVADNPVRAGLCTARDAWPWSGGELL